MTQEIFAVVYTESTHIEGDERSRSHPGHGYPAHTIETQVFKEFKDRAEFEAWVKKETLSSSYSKRSFRAFCCKPIEITTEVKIHFGDTAIDRAKIAREIKSG